MKKLVLFFAIILIIILPASAAHGLNLEDELKNSSDYVLDDLDINLLDGYLQKNSDSINIITGGQSANDFISDLISGEMFINYGSIFDYLGAQLKKGLNSSLPFVIEIVVITLLFSVLNVFYPDFGESYKVAHYARYILISSIAVSVFMRSFNLGIETIDNITGFSNQFFPLLFFLLTSIGGIASASILKPATAALTGFVSVFVKNFISSLLVLLCSVTVLSEFSKAFKLSNLRDLIKSIIKWAIGISFVIFLGCVSLQGLMASSFDGITLKAAKYTIDKAVPIVGGMFSDTMDMLITSSLLIKNAIGIVGVLIIVSMLATPVITMSIQYFMLKLCSSIVEPLGGEDVAKFLKSMSEIILLQNAVLITTGAMFLINIGLILGSGNINIMLR